MPMVCSYAPWSFIMGWFSIAIGLILLLSHPDFKTFKFDLRIASFHIQAGFAAILIVLGIVMVGCNEVYSGVIYLANALGTIG